MIKLIAGLGNPEDKYNGTRHNIGFDIIDAISNHLNLSFNDKFKGLVAEYRINNEKIFFVKPMTYMNLSGECIGAIANFYKINPEEILIIHDEMNIPYNSIKIRHNGSAGGHNGLKSIIAHLNTQNFPRLKVGIGRDRTKDVVSYVLGKFTPEEQKIYNDFINNTMNATIYILNNGLDKAMTIYNR